MDITCGGCDSRWTGLTRAHCGACHLTFNSVGAFDKHRVRFSCQHPETREMIEVEGIWRSPMDDEKVARLKTAP